MSYLLGVCWDQPVAGPQNCVGPKFVGPTEGVGVLFTVHMMKLLGSRQG